MKNSAGREISEKELDELLKQAFTSLDFTLPNNSRILNSVASYSLNSTSSVFILSVAAKKMIVVLLMLGFISAGLILFFTGNKIPNSPIKNKNIFYSSFTPTTNIDQPVLAGEFLAAAATFTRKPAKVFIKEEKKISSRSQTELQWDIEKEISGDTLAAVYTEIHNRAPEEYIFPVLTEKEIKANEKEKRKIVKVVIRVSKEKKSEFAQIPASPNGPAATFYMGSGEVTNIEYRTFLFDLLIKGKKDEFLKAKPNQSLWKNAAGQHVFDTLEKVYFSEKKYNYFPVVNITAEGAEMYCRWLQQEVDIVREKEGIPLVEIRLPTEKDWLYAASSGSAHAVYSWPLATVQNSSNAFMGNFCVQKLKDQLSGPIYYPKYKINLDNYTSAGLVLNDASIATIDVWSYNPNTFGLFGVCGNAAEMVYANNSGEVKVKGGSWASDFEHLKIFGEDEFKEVTASPMIGFRICAFVK